jgi:3-isopropylmalate/(R)-2-methylmalate dehydratase small subunit
MVETQTLKKNNRVRFQGKVWKFGSHVDTDVIIPARYLAKATPSELAKHCMEGIDPAFHTRCSHGDLIVAGWNFGCGSSREHAPIALKAAGISCVIAKSFARIFYRNALNMGLSIVEAPEEAVDATQEGDIILVDLVGGTLENVTQAKTYRTIPFPDFMRILLESGGLIPYVKQRCLARRPT